LLVAGYWGKANGYRVIGWVTGCFEKINQKAGRAFRIMKFLLNRCFKYIKRCANYMKNYRDLEIYIESKRLAIEVHKISLKFPKFELYEEGSQLRRSSKSIAANIVEGYGRARYKGDFIRHLIISLSECDETVFHLEMVYETESYTNENQFQKLMKAYDILGKKINKYIQWLETSS
jgi:four helix bundle protein